MLTIRWAADVTKAGGQVLMYAVEDDDTDTILPRLEAAGADTDRVFIRRYESLDARKLEDYCEQLENVQLVTVDPLTAFFNSQTDAWNTPKIRRFLRPVIEYANRRRFALVGVLHTNRWSDSTDPLSKITEAQGIPRWRVAC